MSGGKWKIKRCGWAPWRSRETSWELERRGGDAAIDEGLDRVDGAR